jgi:hypothetical protein
MRYVHYAHIRTSILFVACSALVLGSFGVACGAANPRVPAPGGVDASARDAALLVEDGGTTPLRLGLDAGARTAEMDASAPQRRGGVSVNGRLPPEVIQAVVRANFGAFRKCYENGLRASPSLVGRLQVKFVIDLEGRVASAADEASDLPDTAIVQCVVDAFRRLEFPRPEGGKVTVIYPIIFNPGE